jgi:hypothetical protein
VISLCLSRAIEYKGGATEELSVGTAARDGKCQVFSLIFQLDFITMFLHFWA